MRYHELALQRWLNSTFYVRVGYPIPIVFATPMDAFGAFDRLWRSDNNPYNYLLALVDANGKPLYEPYPSNVRYPLISVFRRGWKYRAYQNFSIFQWRPINWPTVEREVTLSDLGETSVGHRPMAWDYRWQIDHYAMRPDTQAYFIEALMRCFWRTGGVPQTWIPVHYPAWGRYNVRLYLDGDIENTTLEEPEERKNVEFRTTFTLIMEGFSVDQDIRIVPALWEMLLRAQAVNPGELTSALVLQEQEDLRLHNENYAMLRRPHLPPNVITPEQRLAQQGTYPPWEVEFQGTAQPQAYLNFGRTGTDPASPYFLGGIPQTSGYGIATVVT